MSEIIAAQKTGRAFRWQLLAGVSAAALLSALVSSAEAEESRPTVWIELGGQLERMGDDQMPLSAPFLDATPTPAIFEQASPLALQNKRPKFSYGAEGEMSFSPSGSEWIFSASMRYGRSNGSKSNYARSTVYHRPKYVRHAYNSSVHLFNFENTAVKHRESHVLLDFQVGKDVGLGLFGPHGSSLMNFGVRFAQFTSGSEVTVRARPDLSYKNIANLVVNPRFLTSKMYVPSWKYHNYSLLGHGERSMQALGPSISLTGSTPLVGHSEDTELALDWGANAAVLFGRQKVTSERHVTGRYQTFLSAVRPSAAYQQVAITHYDHDLNIHRRRSVVVPNIGGFLGLSFKFPNAKVSLGYRADIFFGAMDGGNETAKSYDRIFHGPYATISIGLGG